MIMKKISQHFNQQVYFLTTSHSMMMDPFNRLFYHKISGKRTYFILPIPMLLMDLVKSMMNFDRKYARIFAVINKLTKYFSNSP